MEPVVLVCKADNTASIKTYIENDGGCLDAAEKPKPARLCDIGSISTIGTVRFR